MSKKYFIFIGNPQSGKLALLNRQFGKLAFRSSLGNGSTPNFASHIEGKNIFIDVPEQADNNLMKVVAEITKVLKPDGIYKFIFVVGNGLRVSQEDLSTLEVVLNVLVEIPNLQYGLIINKCDKTAIDKVNCAKGTWIDNYCGRFPVKATDVFAYPADPNAYKANDILIPLNESFRNWLDELGANEIKRDTIEIEHYLELKKEYEKLLDSTKTFSGCGPSSAPFGTRYACGVTDSWLAGTASECIIPEGWILQSGSTLCYGHGRCPNGANFGNPASGNIAYNFTIVKKSIYN